MGKVLAVCISEKKGTQKRNVGVCGFLWRTGGLEGGCSCRGSGTGR